MKIGKIYVQRHSDLDLWIKPLRKQKNGALAGLIFRDWLTGRYGGKAVRDSFRFYAPASEVAQGEIPPQILEKFRRAEQ